MSCADAQPSRVSEELARQTQMRSGAIPMHPGSARPPASPPAKPLAEAMAANHHAGLSQMLTHVNSVLDVQMLERLSLDLLYNRNHST